MAGSTGLTDAEKAIYNEFQSVTSAALAKAKADAVAIGSDISSIIGPVEKAVVAEAKKDIAVFWKVLMQLTQFLDSPMVNGVSKFSSKRATLFASVVLGAIKLFKGEDWRAAGCAVVAIIALVAVVLEDIQFLKTNGKT